MKNAMFYIYYPQGHCGSRVVDFKIQIWGNPSPWRCIAVWKDKMIFKVVSGVALFLLILSAPSMAKEVCLNFTDGKYFKDEWVVTSDSMSARYIPHERHPVACIIRKGSYRKVTGVSMNMQLCTTIGAARANVYMDCGGNRDGFQINTYPHPQLWKNNRQWRMSEHCLEILNKRGELQLVVNVYWDGHGVFRLSDLKMEVE